MELKVSVIMAVLNGERFIDEAIQSIVDQTYRPIELVVVDDGSTDTTRQHVDRFGPMLEIRYVRHDVNQGIARSINDGLAAATGDLIAFLDHDDAWLPEFLETQTSYLREHPEVAMVHSDFQTIDGVGKVIEGSVAASRGRQRPSGDVFSQLFMDSFIVGNSVVVRRECLDRLGGFDEALRWGDYHLWLRVALHYRIDYVDKVLTKYRQHSGQETRSTTAPPPDEVPVALKAIDLLLEQYPEARNKVSARTIRQRRASFHFNLAYSWHGRGDSAKARECLRKALRLWPENPRYLKFYAVTFFTATQNRGGKAAFHIGK